MRLVIFFLLFSSIGYSQQRPNIIYIMSDDHDSKAISAYDKTLISTPNIDRIANEGILFNRCFVGNSICSPVRATLLTGQHSHKNGVKDNTTRFDSSRITMPKLLQQAGYQTALIGKWHLHSYPTGFDYWKILPGQGQYFETSFINMQGDTAREHGYASDLITDEAIRWLDGREKNPATGQAGKPFLLLLHHKAPHRYFFPPLKYLEKFHNKIFPEPATLYVDTAGHGSAWRIQTMGILDVMKLSSDLKVDPKYLMDIPWLKPDAAEIAYYNAIMNRIPQPDRDKIKEIYSERGKLLQQQKPKGKALLKLKYQWYMQDYLACVASVDENVGRILKYLDDNDLTKNTMVVYTSDQGMYLGENGWFDKRFMYDKSMKTPLMIRWPGQIKPKTKTDAMVQNIDFAPTFLHAAGVDIPNWMQGVSLLPILEGKKKSPDRSYLYYHYYEFGRDHTVIPHLGIRGEQYKLIYFYTVNEWEFYDIKNDPQEQHNLVDSKAYEKIIQQYKAELNKLRNLYDDHEPAGELH
jgi:arylsulfatase A-like enzyme